MVPDFSGPRDEVAWLLGMPAASQLPGREAAAPRESASFPRGGFYVLRHRDHHVFIDCGPLGLAGRGGHGHNDLLSFELALHGIKLVSDCGAHVYTASVEERNAFRSTAYHSTPKIDGEEINRFVRPDYLWSLHNDARHVPRRFEVSATHSVFEGSHDGYGRLAQPVTVVRRFELDHVTGALTVTDQFEGSGEHHVAIPFHLAPGVSASPHATGALELHAGGTRFALRPAEAAGWSCTVRPGRVSPAYGVAVPSQVVVFERRGALQALQVRFEPAP